MHKTINHAALTSRDEIEQNQGSELCKRSIQYLKTLKTARTLEEQYFERYQYSIEQPDKFWAEQAQRLDWIKPFTQVKNTSFNKDDFKIEWFADGQLNVSANCLTGI